MAWSLVAATPKSNGATASPVTLTGGGEGAPNPIPRRRYVIRGPLEPEMILLLLDRGIITREQAAILLAMS